MSVHEKISIAQLSRILEILYNHSLFNRIFKIENVCIQRKVCLIILSPLWLEGNCYHVFFLLKIIH